MKEYKTIVFLTGDLGFGGADKIQKELPDQYLNCGAAEHSLMGIAIGLAMTGKIPFVYSISTFALYRPFEMLRNYAHHDNIPIKIVGSGRDKDYANDGWSHDASDAKQVLAAIPNIIPYFPETIEEMEKDLKEIIDNDKPTFLSLKR